ncbi:MAG: HEAT repeat domain-containing protein [Acidobacteriaceae bacterium]|nr:HEAT repeat domain-containing protein [Acidobacteriaceae bacterium]
MSCRSFCRLALCGSLIGLLLFGQTEDGYNATQRIKRIRELGKKNNPAVLPALAQYLTDPDREIRVDAVKAIVKIDTEHSLDALVQATGDKDDEVQVRATDGLVNVYLPGYISKAGLTGTTARDVRQAKASFSSRNDQIVDADVEIRPDVAKALADLIPGGASMTARANAALATGILRDRTAVPALVQGLHGRDGDLIFECLVALQKIRDQSAGPEVNFLTHDLEDRIQTTALETIGVLRSTSSAPDVRSALQSARNIKVRRAALEALAMLGMAEDRTIFLQYAQDRDVELRASALEGLGRIREPEDFPLLQNSFNEADADWRIHLAAAFAMVNEGKVDTSTFSPLAYLMQCLGTKPRSATASAYLTELAAHADVRSALAGMIPELDKWQKVALCSVLSAAQTPEVVPTLNVLAKDVDPDVVFAASKALRIAQTRRSS